MIFHWRVAVAVSLSKGMEMCDAWEVSALPIEKMDEDELWALSGRAKANDHESSSDYLEHNE